MEHIQSGPTRSALRLRAWAAASAGSGAGHRPCRFLPLVALLALASCDGCGDTPFAYDLAAAPRVSVIHQPLNPGPGDPVTVIARPEAAAGRSVDEVRITLIRPGGAGLEEHTCAPADLDPDGHCVFAVAGLGEAGTAVYGASMTDDEGTEGRAPSSYSFLVGDPPAGDRIRPLRVPVLVPGAQLFRVLLVRDRESYGDDAAALQAARVMLYDGLLDDPAHRWRDAQLAFYYTTRDGITRDYHSGLQSRCGGRPWAGTADESAAESEATGFAVVGVLHEKSYRDCAGAGLDAGDQRRFSANGTDPLLFRHEFGHALALLSDEYLESTASRRMRTDSIPDPFECMCCDPGDGQTGGGVTTGAVTPGGGLTPGGEPSTAGGLTPQQVCPPGVPPCTGFVPPPVCHTALSICPPLGSECLRPNVFPSVTACQTAATEINAHPGVESTADPADCRLLCSGDECPCMPTGSTAEFWILDPRTPPTGAPPTADDVMGVMDALQPSERHGPACARCIEDTYCMRWEIGRGQSEVDAQAHCMS